MFRIDYVKQQADVAPRNYNASPRDVRRRRFGRRAGRFIRTPYIELILIFCQVGMSDIIRPFRSAIAAWPAVSGIGRVRLTPRRVGRAYWAHLPETGLHRTNCGTWRGATRQMGQNTAHLVRTPDRFQRVASHTMGYMRQSNCIESTSRRRSLEIHESRPHRALPTHYGYSFFCYGGYVARIAAREKTRTTQPRTCTLVKMRLGFFGTSDTSTRLARRLPARTLIMRPNGN